MILVVRCMSATFSLSNIATGSSSSLMLCAVVDIVDDTTLVRKAVFGELGKDMEVPMTDVVGSRLLTHLLTPETSMKQKFFEGQMEHLCHSEKESWDQLEVVESCDYRGEKFKMKSIQICKTHWVQKHASAIAFFVPKIKKFLAEDYTKYAQIFISRRIMSALVNYAEKTDPKWKGPEPIDAELVAQIKEALTNTKLPKLPKKKPDAGTNKKGSTDKKKPPKRPALESENLEPKKKKAKVSATASADAEAAIAKKPVVSCDVTMENGEGTMPKKPKKKKK